MLGGSKYTQWIATSLPTLNVSISAPQRQAGERKLALVRGPKSLYRLRPCSPTNVHRSRSHPLCEVAESLASKPGSPRHHTIDSSFETSGWAQPATTAAAQELQHSHVSGRPTSVTIETPGQRMVLYHVTRKQSNIVWPKQPRVRTDCTLGTCRSRSQCHDTTVAVRLHELFRSRPVQQLDSGSSSLLSVYLFDRHVYRGHVGYLLSQHTPRKRAISQSHECIDISGNLES